MDSTLDFSPTPGGLAGPVYHHQTLQTAIVRSGLGLHSGTQTQVRLLPAPLGHGRRFKRVDLPDSPVIPAQLDQIHPTLLSTELGQGSCRVRTVEHLLAALAGLGVSNVLVEIDGPEVPLLDGSAQEWVAAIHQAGLAGQGEPLPPPQVLEQPLWVRQGEAFVAGFPAPETRCSYGIDFPQAPAIGNQWYSWRWSVDSFVADIAPARTFGLAEQVEALRQQGLIQGGSLDNALVCSAEGWLNPPLRFANEPVRHKLLDLLGDLSLLGTLPQAHIFAYKASHQLHLQFAQALAQLIADA